MLRKSKPTPPSSSASLLWLQAPRHHRPLPHFPTTALPASHSSPPILSAIPLPCPAWMPPSLCFRQCQSADCKHPVRYAPATTRQMARGCPLPTSYVSIHATAH